MADEDGESSFHGQLKCEGIYKGGRKDGRFRTLVH
jgi:hypothetical protein